MTLPRLGVATRYASFEILRDWIFDHDRTIEIQDFVFPDVIAGDTAPMVETYRKALDGHQGLRGIHGPFFGLDLSNPDRDIREIVQRRFAQGPRDRRGARRRPDGDPQPVQFLAHAQLCELSRYPALALRCQRGLPASGAGTGGGDRLHARCWKTSTTRHPPTVSTSSPRSTIPTSSSPSIPAMPNWRTSYGAPPLVDFIGGG
jgi:hypothetical protein